MTPAAQRANYVEGLDLSDPNNWIRVHPQLHAKYVMDSQRLHEVETDLELLHRENERLKRIVAHDHAGEVVEGSDPSGRPDERFD